MLLGKPSVKKPLYYKLLLPSAVAATVVANLMLGSGVAQAQSSSDSAPQPTNTASCQNPGNEYTGDVYPRAQKYTGDVPRAQSFTARRAASSPAPR